MTTKKSTETKKDICKGGASFGRKRYEHKEGTRIACYRCGSVMGCAVCCEPLDDLICLNCHNWAHPRGVERHGDVVPNRKVRRVRTDKGWRVWTPLQVQPGQALLQKISELLNHKISRAEYTVWLREHGFDQEAIDLEKLWDGEADQYAKTKVVREQMAKTRPWMLYDWEREEQAEHRPEGPSDGKEKN